ncbi:MAG: protein kinase [Alphaproteobacteria bacterium]|nr:protein kinase [Alphaproteobacteria bacterium]
MRRTFKIHRCIGKGAFGEVYQATVHEGDRPARSVALKLLQADVNPKGLAVERLRDEHRMLRALDHPNVLQADDLAVIDGRVALVTEYIPGLDLWQLASRAPLPDGVVLEIAVGLADALWQAQTTLVDGQPLALVHRDIKPPNIRIGSDGQFRLLDFGVARSDGIDREALTGDDTLLGSLHYMAPEILSTAKSSAATDVYALGVTLYYAATGRSLFREHGADLLKIVFVPEKFVETTGKRLLLVRNAGVRELVASMLELEPENRPTHEQVRDRALALLAEIDLPPDGKSRLARFAASYEWPEQKTIAGGLSGRVFEEELVDPSAVGVGKPRMPEVDDQENTQLDIWSETHPDQITEVEGTEAPEPEAPELPRPRRVRRSAPEPAEPSDGPEATDGPEPTDPLEITETPADPSDGPEATEGPEATDGPEATEGPESTDVPGASGGPGAADGPRATDGPRAIDAAPAAANAADRAEPAGPAALGGALEPGVHEAPTLRLAEKPVRAPPPVTSERSAERPVAPSGGLPVRVVLGLMAFALVTGVVVGAAVVGSILAMR